MNLKNITTKLGNDLEKILFNNTLNIFEPYIFKIKKVYLNSFSDTLLSLEIPSDSLANPEFFYEAYSEALDNFTYFTVMSANEIKLRVPDEDNFDYTGRMFFINLLTSGVVGNYLEISSEDYNYLMNSTLSDQLKKTLQELPGFLGDVDSENSYLDFYILDMTIGIHTILQKILKKDLVVFPFSNTPPIDLFTDGIDFFTSIKDTVTDMIVTKSINDFKGLVM